MTARFRIGGAGSALVSVVTLSLAMGCGEAPSGGATSPAASVAEAPLQPQAPPTITLAGVAALTTQWYPNNSECNTTTENRLLREVIRQGVLMAMREELGLVTRDETLGEPLTNVDPDAADSDIPPVEPFALDFHWDRTNVWHAELSGAGAPADNPVWKHDGTFKFKNRTFYADFAAQMTQLCEPIAQQLRAAGATGTRGELNPENVPTAETEAQLGEMNFVSQYAAVRSAHLAMAEKGPSLPWLGVLVRGYANLAMLTQHTWNSQHDAFAARSILYAERLMQLSERSRSARLHQAYAYAVIGMHGHVLDLMAANVDENGASPSEADADPTWAALIEPFAKFQPTELERLAAAHEEQAELAMLLRWNVYRSYMHDRWINDFGMESMAACPEAYSIYSVMANWPALGVKRMGASAAISVFGQRLPERVASLPDAPKSVRAFGAPSTPLLSRLLGVGADGELNHRPIKIARALHAETFDETQPTEFSWSVLGAMIAEEQFVQAVHLLVVSSDAVEHSMESLIEQLKPLVKGHRYATYIEIFALPPHERQRAADIMRDVRIVDPRPSMRRMFGVVWLQPTAHGGRGYDFASRAIWSRNFTQPNLHDNWYGVSEAWIADVPAEHRRHFAREFREISPHSPQAARLQWETAENCDATQLSAWETELGDDPIGWYSLGTRYDQLNKLDDSTRCYQRSLAISPSQQATVGLANAHWSNGKKELWKPTLEAYLNVEDLGLNHAQIHGKIADECVGRRSWSEAEPHALEAAQTYASWGLEQASVVYEGERRWDRSEHFIAEASRNYPSSTTGASWYFWCQRTGRGDLETAKAIAESGMAAAAASAVLDDAQRTFVYRLLEGDVEKALPGLEGQLKLTSRKEGLWSRAWRLLHTIAVADETDNAALKRQSLEELRELNKQEVELSAPEWVMVLETLALAFEGEEPNQETLAKYDKVIEGGSLNGRCNYQYYMGAALNSLGQAEAADDYWRRAAFGGPFSNYNCTLAGHRLAVRHGPDRGGVPDRYVKQEAEAEAAWAKLQEAAANSQVEEPSEGSSDSEEPEPDTTI